MLKWFSMSPRVGGWLAAGSGELEPADRRWSTLHRLHPSRCPAPSCPVPGPPLTPTARSHPLGPGPVPPRHSARCPALFLVRKWQGHKGKPAQPRARRAVAPGTPCSEFWLFSKRVPKRDREARGGIPHAELHWGAPLSGGGAARRPLLFTGRTQSSLGPAAHVPASSLGRRGGGGMLLSDGDTQVLCRGRRAAPLRTYLVWSGAGTLEQPCWWEVWPLWFGPGQSPEKNRPFLPLPRGERVPQGRREHRGAEDSAGTWRTLAPGREEGSGLQPLQPAGDFQEQSIVPKVTAPLSPDAPTAHPDGSFFLFICPTWEHS